MHDDLEELLSSRASDMLNSKMPTDICEECGTPHDDVDMEIVLPINGSEPADPENPEVLNTRIIEVPVQVEIMVKVRITTVR